MRLKNVTAEKETQKAQENTEELKKMDLKLHKRIELEQEDLKRNYQRFSNNKHTHKTKTLNTQHTPKKNKKSQTEPLIITSKQQPKRRQKRGGSSSSPQRGLAAGSEPDCDHGEEKDGQELDRDCKADGRDAGLVICCFCFVG